MNRTDKPDKYEEATRWYQAGRSLAEAGEHKEAIEAFGTALSRNPELADAYFLRSASCYHLGRYVQAGQDLDAAALLGCRDAQFWSRYETGTEEDTEEHGTD